MFCAVCLLAMSRSDRQHGCNCEEKIAKRTEMEDKINDESEKTSTHTYHTPVPGTWYFV